MGRKGLLTNTQATQGTFNPQVVFLPQRIQGVLVGIYHVLGHGLAVSGKSKGKKGEGRLRNRSRGSLTCSELLSKRGNESNTIVHTLAKVLTGDLKGHASELGLRGRSGAEQGMR